MDTITITKPEMRHIEKVLHRAAELEACINNVGNHFHLRQLSSIAHELPKRIVQFLVDFKYDESKEGVCLLGGFEVDDSRLADTPFHWRDAEADGRTKRESLFLMVTSALLGDAIGWSTQQDGRVVHNIVPIQGDEHKQVGSSTLSELWWHTEEAFHPCRCDYLGLFCLRNQERAATTYASVNTLRLSDSRREMLFSPYYSVYPDSSHLTQGKDGHVNMEGVIRLSEFPNKVPVLFGSAEQPYLCIDPYYMEMDIREGDAREALKEIIDEISRNLRSVVLKPGELLFVDNYRAVHGRQAYAADYSGRGRWLKRVNVVRDLRKSRQLRNNFASRIIETA